MHKREAKRKAKGQKAGSSAVPCVAVSARCETRREASRSEPAPLRIASESKRTESDLIGRRTADASQKKEKAQKPEEKEKEREKKEESNMPGTAKGTDRFNTSGPDHGCDAVVSARVASERSLCSCGNGCNLCWADLAVSARVQPYLPQPSEA